MSGTSTITNEATAAPGVAIALAAYEPPIEYFREQLASIVAQTHRDWVCVIGIDGDADALMARHELAEYVSDRRFRWCANPERLGHRRNFERTIARAAALGGEYIACADQDDVWHPDKITRLVDRARRAGRLSLVHSDMELMRDGRVEHASVWKASRRGVERDRLDEVIVANIVNGCSMLFDAELARRFPEIPESFGFHDHWFAALAAAHGGIHRVDAALMQYRQHGSNVVGASEFDWSIRIPRRSGLRGEIDADVARWRTVRARIDDLDACGVRLNAFHRFELLSPADLGLLLALRGLIETFRAPRLSRYLLRLAIGKVFETLRPGGSAGESGASRIVAKEE